MRKIRFRDGDSGFIGTRAFRLAGVRAPESYQFGGLRARRRASYLTRQSSGPVRVHRVGYDSYGRELVEITTRYGSVNRRLRRYGYTNKGR